MKNNIKYIGVDIGGSHTKIALVNTEYELLNEESIFYGNLDPTLKPKCIYEHITKYIDSLPNEIFKQIIGIGVACPGMTKNNKIIGAVNLGGNSDILIKIEKKYNLPLYSTNDAVAASFAQLKKGSLINIDNAI